MAGETERLVRREFRSPRAAAIAGIVYSLLIITVMLLTRRAGSVQPEDITVEWLETWSGGFVPAIVAAVVIAVVSALIVWLAGALGLSLGGFLGAIVHLIIAALVLMFAGNLVKGLKVKGFVGALVAAVAIAVVSWLIDGVVGLVF